MTHYTYEQILRAYNYVSFNASDESKEAMAMLILETVNDAALTISIIQREAEMLDTILGR